MSKISFKITWAQASNIGPLSFVCGYCSDKVGGFTGSNGIAEGSNQNCQGRIYICTSCSYPSFFITRLTPESNVVDIVSQSPASSYGESVAHLPLDVSAAYAEVRACVQAEAYSAAVMMCRKLLMHLAVDKAGASAGGTFVSYIDSLESGGFIAPPDRPWVDKIRSLENDANHELSALTREQALMAVDFIAMLLKLLYEYPHRALSLP